MEGVSVLRNHEWVMERVKLRRREESRLKREKYGSKNTTIWSPSMEQVCFRRVGVVSERRKVREEGGVEREGIRARTRPSAKQGEG